MTWVVFQTAVMFWFKVLPLSLKPLDFMLWKCHSLLLLVTLSKTNISNGLDVLLTMFPTQLSVTLLSVTASKPRTGWYWSGSQHAGYCVECWPYESCTSVSQNVCIIIVIFRWDTSFLHWHLIYLQVLFFFKSADQPTLTF